MKIFVVGSVNMDLAIRAPQMPKRGMTVEGGGFLAGPGGKGANQAVACAKLGGEAYMVGCVGAAFGNELFEALRGYHVHTEYVVRREDVPSGIAVILIAEGDNRIVLDRGANGTLERADVDRALSSAEKGDLLIVQLEIAPALAAYALASGRARGMTTLLNPAPACDIPASCFSDCDYFIPNQTEAEFYTGIYPETEEDVVRCAEILAEKGVKELIVTLGEKGSAYAGSAGRYAIPAYPAETVDTTAAGDTFVGALAVRLSEGADVRSAMRFAGKAAALTVTRRGAQQSIPLRAEADALPDL